ncbi:MAG: hypothetical protein HY423_01805 [Candidatus Lambdaproteobacteria bacterium]|nr:hypothetical protein [Candidatus Lambdaproteobacteria bacterium]
MRTLYRIAALLLLLLLLATSTPAAEQGTLYRIYYAPLVQGTVAESPLDPDGAYKAKPVSDGPKAAIEALFFRRLGLSGTRQTMSRKFTDSAGLEREETAVHLSLDLTLYAVESRHNGFNAFLGTGQGIVESYKFKIDGIRQDDSSLYRNIAMTRLFAGIEYTFDRVGVRLEGAQIQARKEKAAGKAVLDERLYNLTFYIPLN